MFFGSSADIHSVGHTWKLRLRPLNWLRCAALDLIEWLPGIENGRLDLATKTFSSFLKLGTQKIDFDNSALFGGNTVYTIHFTDIFVLNTLATYIIYLSF